MNCKLRWDPCIVHRGDSLDGFLQQYLGRPDRKILLVAGAGFDPRTQAVAARLSATKAKIHALLIEEVRPDPSQKLLARAKANKAALLKALTRRQLQRVEVFGSDNALVGGRNVVKILRQQGLETTTDVVVDISALSVGMSFPIVRYFFECIVHREESVNLHVFVAHAPELDAGVRAKSGDDPGYVHGFRGRSTLDDARDAARLWLPQLVVCQTIISG